MGNLISSSEHRASNKRRHLISTAPSTLRLEWVPTCNKCLPLLSATAQNVHNLTVPNSKHIYNNCTNYESMKITAILDKMEKSSETGEEKKILVSIFACFLNAIAKF